VSLDPFIGIQNAVTRQRHDGTPAGGWVPEQRVTLDQALAAYTRDAAWGQFEEGIKGTLTSGKLADVLVVDGDVLNDIAIAIRSLQKSKEIERALTVDCDVHQGNGTAAIFAGDPSVFTLSIHQENNYPYPKPPSSLDINLPDRVDDDGYLVALGEGIDKALAEFEPQLMIYVAGADPYREDQLGGLKLTLEGLEKRDRLVFEKARSRRIPVAVTFAGGYARKVEDTVTIHTNTIRIAKEFAL